MPQQGCRLSARGLFTNTTCRHVACGSLKRGACLARPKSCFLSFQHPLNLFRNQSCNCWKACTLQGNLHTCGELAVAVAADGSGAHIGECIVKLAGAVRRALAHAVGEGAAKLVRSERDVTKYVREEMSADEGNPLYV
jgi:hypothetical protein